MTTKRDRNIKNKEEKKKIAFAKLNNSPISPRKMRLVADMIRGKKIEEALTLLKFNSKFASIKIEKLLLSAISNWENKNEGKRKKQALKGTKNFLATAFCLCLFFFSFVCIFQESFTPGV